MKPVRIADSGLIAGGLDPADAHHKWAANEFRRGAPFQVCEPVLTEAAFVVGADPVLTLLERGDLQLGFALEEMRDRVAELVRKYADRTMSLADACVVAMSERHSACRVWTIDKDDFTVYRRHGRQSIPCEFPD